MPLEFVLSRKVAVGTDCMRIARDSFNTRRGQSTLLPQDASRVSIFPDQPPAEVCNARNVMDSSNAMSRRPDVFPSFRFSFGSHVESAVRRQIVRIAPGGNDARSEKV